VEEAEMAEFYGPANRQIQDRFDTRRIADHFFDRIIRPAIREQDREFIEARDMLFLSTVDENGTPNCSYKGGDPGFIKVLDEHTIAFPSYDGNGMYLSMGSILGTGKVGILFIDFEGQRRMRLNGDATIDWDDPLMAEYPEAQFIVRVKATHVFPNCPRYIHKMAMVERSKFVPHVDCETPMPNWKLDNDRALLPKKDQEKLAATDGEPR
jgi:predicted pyridoxine 5'-phosphate oxidase superfamily flavin-nucleotide-binding protein